MRFYASVAIIFVLKDTILAEQILWERMILKGNVEGLIHLYSKGFRTLFVLTIKDYRVMLSNVRAVRGI